MEPPWNFNDLDALANLKPESNYAASGDPSAPPWILFFNARENLAFKF